jgi:uncharacterized protein (TIGR02145 family)
MLECGIFKKLAKQISKTTVLVIIAMLVVSAANAQKPKLAVMDFMAGVGLYQNDVNGLSDMLINSLFNTGRFELIERGQLCQLIEETNLQKSSLSAGQLQQLAIKGVNFLLLGTVNLTGGEYNIDIRVVDVGTGQLYSTAGVTKLSTQTYRDMMPKLANELATKLPQVVNATVTVSSAFAQETGVIINGVKWATRNVGKLFTFADKPEDYGGFYSWYEAQKVCPKGWRLPTISELESLVNAGSAWISQNGNNGRKFGSNSNNIFLPAAGNVGTAGNIVGNGLYGIYWSSITSGSLGRGTIFSNHAHHLIFTHSYIDASTETHIEKVSKFSVRCVAE